MPFQPVQPKQDRSLKARAKQGSSFGANVAAQLGPIKFHQSPIFFKAAARSVLSSIFFA